MMEFGRNGRRALIVGMVAVICSAATGCTTSGSSNENDPAIAGSGASCAYRVMYEGRMYKEATGKGAEVAQKIGIAREVRCEETNATAGRRTAKTEGRVLAYAIDGIDPRWAVAVGESPRRTLIVVRAGANLPNSVMKVL